VLLLAGFLFKLGSFPFHFWLPDIYQTAPHEVVAYLATVSKVAAIAMLCRLVSLFADAQMPEVLMWLSVAAMTLGNFAALVQKDLKRLLGYSAVAHAGYILLAVQTGALLGFSAALFYALGYLLMSFICFLVVCELGRDSDAVSVESLRGLHHRSPLLAASLMVGLFGLIGLPPTVGFIGKWFLFSAALEQGQFGLVLVAAVNTVVALYYYLLVLRAAYLEDAPDAAMIQLRPIVRITALVSIAAVLALGTFPGRFWAMAARAAEALG
jgi:NADH-quinone oxidoreductase subunit N